MAEDTTDLRIARRLKEIRLARGLTLARLASLVGMSSAHLSRLETGERQPSVGALIQLARAHEMSLGKLVGEDEEPARYVVRRGQEALRQSANGPYVALSGPFPGLQAVRLELDPEAEPPRANHPGEEWLYVLDGSARLLLDQEPIRLDAGDACHFNAGLDHELSAVQGKATVLLVSTAARSWHAPLSPHVPG
ncbi:helix-turn-helix transcriptional regulator [Amycolatopsis acidicola]|uniref:Helix-turn-helix transcriptional regulator n=1 Tax=Amycolatopsis acidicola TaxID=2596893 RepID=A0A5N0ULE4_9PSEU|nr:XRE family transcriptional regulator [Amycolatopsis acidicola]KAA9148127.1 helix-turn-helix transcriptional regulator [Amycolatopsis acidicola]